MTEFEAIEKQKWKEKKKGARNSAKKQKPYNTQTAVLGQLSCNEEEKTKEKMLPYYHLFSRDFNSANLEQKYFAGLKFRDFDESPFFKVINKFRESSTLELGF